MIFSKEIQAFTLVELIVAASILAILTTIGFYSYTSNISSARDSVRQTDISKISSELKLYKRQRWAYPLPWDFFELRNGWSATVAYQGLMNNKVSLSTAESLSLDPELELPYTYSVSRTKQEYQLAASMENDGSPYAYLVWDYKSVAKTVLPNIILAISSTTPVNIAISNNQELFIFHKGIRNLPYDFETGLPYNDGSNTSLSNLLIESWADYWQNSDYRNCSEINLAAKNITQSGSTDQYETLNTSGILETGPCDWVL